MTDDQLKDALAANLQKFRSDSRQVLDRMLAKGDDPSSVAEWEKVYRDHEVRLERLILELA